MKDQKREFVQRIEGYYVADDCMQIMIPHIEDTISVFNAEEIIYHSKPSSYLYTNKYISDSRKDQFPYSQIPTHSEFVNGHRVEYINQLYDFNKVYIIIADGIVREDFALKDKNEALLATKYILPIKQPAQYLNRQQLEELIQSYNGAIFHLDGSLVKDFSIPGNDQILNWYRERIISQRNRELAYNSSNNEELSDYIYKSLDKLTLKDIPSNVTLFDSEIFVSKQDGKNGREISSIKGINAKYIEPDKFLVEMYDYPVTIYSLDHMKKLEQTNYRKTSEPKFPWLLNSRIDSGEVKKEKQKVRALVKTYK